MIYSTGRSNTNQAIQLLNYDREEDRLWQTYFNVNLQFVFVSLHHILSTGAMVDSHWLIG